MMHKITFTAHNEEAEPDRIGRLKQTLGIATAIATLADAATHDPELWSDGDEPVFGLDVIGLHDHKGMLTVTFRTIRAADEFAPCFLLAWQAMNECLVDVVCGHYRKRVGISMDAA